MPKINVLNTVKSLTTGKELIIRQLTKEAQDKVDNGIITNVKDLVPSDYIDEPMILKNVLLLAFDQTKRPESYKKADEEMKIFTKINKADPLEDIVELTSDEIVILKEKVYNSNQPISTYYAIVGMLEG